MRARLLPLLAVISMVSASPLLTGCLERSTTVGDRYSGTIVVATSPDNQHGAPHLDLPESMSSRVSVTDYQETPESTTATPSPDGTTPSTTPPADPGTADGADHVIRVGSRASFSGLTAGQLGQLGDIVAAAFGDDAATMELTAQRSGEVVRLRGDADLTGLTANRDYVQMTIAFGGPVTATNGEQTTTTSVTWTPEAGKPTKFSADATYPDPATAALGSWSWFMIILCLVVVGIIVWIAFRNRHRGHRPGRPVRVTAKPTGTTPTRTTSTDAKSTDAKSTSGASGGGSGDKATSA